jgi:hypothetical protein
MRFTGDQADEIARLRQDFQELEMAKLETEVVQVDEIARLRRKLEMANLETEVNQIQVRSFLRRELIEENCARITMLKCDLEIEDEKKRFHQIMKEYEDFEGDAPITSPNLDEWWTELKNYTRSDEHQKVMRKWFGNPNTSLEPVEETATGNVTDNGEPYDSGKEGSIPSYDGEVRLCYLISIVLA